jgi:hypothetical protein
MVVGSQRLTSSSMLSLVSVPWCCCAAGAELRMCFFHGRWHSGVCSDARHLSFRFDQDTLSRYGKGGWWVGGWGIDRWCLVPAADPDRARSSLNALALSVGRRTRVVVRSVPLHSARLSHHLELHRPDGYVGVTSLAPRPSMRLTSRACAGLYGGLGPSLIGAGAAWASFFGLYSVSKRQLKQWRGMCEEGVRLVLRPLLLRVEHVFVLIRW